MRTDEVQGRYPSSSRRMAWSPGATDGTISGVVPTGLPSRNTLAPVGRESTASDPVARAVVGVAAGGAVAAAALRDGDGAGVGTIARFTDCEGRDDEMTTRRS